MLLLWLFCGAGMLAGCESRPKADPGLKDRLRRDLEGEKVSVAAYLGISEDKIVGFWVGGMNPVTKAAARRAGIYDDRYIYSIPPTRLPPGNYEWRVSVPVEVGASLVVGEFEEYEAEFFYDADKKRWLLDRVIGPEKSE